MTTSYQLPFRITIGVTGHRNLDPETLPAFRKTLQRILDDIKSRHAYEGQTSFGWRILSPLAEGADRLVAEEVLKRPEGALLRAVLPLTVSDYLEDFSTDQSKEEFQYLLAKDRSPMTLKKSTLQNEYPPEMVREARRQAYENVGRFVVEHCDILIALWDGKESRGKGGTADIIAYADKQKCPRYTILTTAPDEFEFITGRDDIQWQYKKLDHLNRQIAAALLEPRIQEKYDDLFTVEKIKEESGKISDGLKKDVRERLLPYYVVADHLAATYQNLYMKTGTRIFFAALFATAIVAISVTFCGRPPWPVFVIEFLILSAIVGSYWYADKIKGAHKNWRAYRFLAERIRCAIFLAVGGVEPAPLFFKRRDDEGNPQKQDYQWLIIAFDEIWNRIPQRKITDSKDMELRKNYIIKAWIEDQIEYHKGNTDKKSSKSKKWETTGETIFYCAMGAAALHIVFSMSDFHFDVIDKLLIFVALILPSVATVAESIRSHHQFKYLATHSQMMASDINKLSNDFTLLTPKRFEDLLLETDHLMMKEVQDWIALTGSTHLSKAV